jgi:hypothetical protein
MDLLKVRQVVAQGYAFFLPDEMEFDPDKPYTGCLLCGEVFQSRMDRRVPPGHEPHNSMIAKLAQEHRRNWAKSHSSKKHTETERRQHRMSGRFAMPEAAQNLAAMGLFSVIDIVIDNEVQDALAKAPNLPRNDVEGD